MCNGGSLLQSEPHYMTILGGSYIPGSSAFTALEEFGICCGVRPWGPYTAVAGHTTISVLNCQTANFDTTPVTLEMRVQPCPTCIVQSEPVIIESLASSYTFTSVDWVQFQPAPSSTYLCSTGNTYVVSPATVTCPDYENTLLVTLSSTDAETNCELPVVVHDNTPSVLVCPVSSPLPIPVSECVTSFTPPATLTMCAPGLGDFPYGDYTDDCKGDPRFSLVAPSSIQAGGPAAYDLYVPTSVTVVYSQTQQDGLTVVDNTASPCVLDMTVLHIVYPQSYSADSPTPIKRGYTYNFNFVSSIQYLQAGSAVDEIEFRILLQEVSPPLGQVAEIVAVTSTLAQRSPKDIISSGTFDVLPSLRLRSNLYYLVLQGRYSLSNSVTNPILNIASS